MSSIISRQQIDSLYKRVGVSNPNPNPSTRLNKGTLNNKLVTDFSGCRTIRSSNGNIYDSSWKNYSKHFADASN